MKHPMTYECDTVKPLIPLLVQGYTISEASRKGGPKPRPRKPHIGSLPADA